MADCDFIPIPHPPVYGAPFVRSTTLRTCPVCGEQFTEEGRRGPKAKTSYCSRTCWRLGNSKDFDNLLRIESGAPVFKCLECGAEFTGKKRKFCGAACMATNKNKRGAEIKRKRIDENRLRAFKPSRRPNPIVDGVRVCLDCSTTLPLSAYAVRADPKCKSGQTIRGVCIDCEKKERSQRGKRRKTSQRQAERARMAEKRGKQYRPGGHDSRRGISRVPFSVLQSRVAKQNAKQAWDWWLTQAPDEWVAAYWEATEEPWRNPRLSNTEKYRLRYSMDLEFNIKERIRRQHAKKAKRDGVGELIRGAIRRNTRSRRVEELCGYSIAELRAHLERQFVRGMDWPGFLKGEIHIDHIIPQKEFDLQDDERWRKCWCLSNLRPLWARDNLEKRDRVLFLL